MVLKAIVLEIDIDELRVAASRLAGIESRLFIALANYECFPRDICGLTGSILLAVCEERALAGAQGLWRRPKKGEGQILCGCATDWEDIISVSMRVIRIRGGTYVSEHSIPYHLV